MNRLFGVHHLNDIIAVAGDDAYLIDVLLLGFDTDWQHGGLNEALLQSFLTYRLDRVDKDISAFGLVLVLGKFRASCEL